MTNDRRNFIKKGTFGFLGISFLSSNTTYSKDKNLKPLHDFKLLPVEVSKERIIRNDVGLRPYRAEGFVLKKEKFQNKTIIHDYGHGGGGISLSWGTAQKAVDMVDVPKEEIIAVIGCGVIGLSTAILLQKKGYNVIIYTKEMPPHTTSNVAGGYYAAAQAYDPNKISEHFLTQFNESSQISHRIFQDLVGERYGVSWIKNYFLDGNFAFWGGKNLFPGLKIHTDKKLFDFPKVQEVYSLVIQTPKYLNALIEDFYLAGGKIEIKEFDTKETLLKLKEKVIMNCTGLGSRELFKDKKLIPSKGQLHVLLPQKEINYSYVFNGGKNTFYMFPREDGIILGGTAQDNIWTLEPDEKEMERIFKQHKMIADFLKKH
ncbi:FAD-dependent oxidoreductase [Aureivirga sp. CE67]|uniref:FAD-dependent oxidoreductase n=1 Tax=Aureivirga sp. CE67 TaxID=1788983 RepID=UPI0018C9CA5D|nr:FAD-dependent oxidoreductase [Aureivirga sp. CE67]